jgi:hypothetical protein
MATEVIAMFILKQGLLATTCISQLKRLGSGQTGIGAFYDDEMHRYLALTPTQGQVVYHFAIGYRVPHPRLSAPNFRGKPHIGILVMSANLQSAELRTESDKATRLEAGRGDWHPPPLTSY